MDVLFEVIVAVSIDTRGALGEDHGFAVVERDREVVNCAIALSTVAKPTVHDTAVAPRLVDPRATLGKRELGNQHHVGRAAAGLGEQLA